MTAIAPEPLTAPTPSPGGSSEAENQAPPKRRYLFKVMCATVVLLAALGFGLAWWTHALRAEGEGMLREAEARAAALRVREVPPGQNASAIYEQAFAMVPQPVSVKLQRLKSRLKGFETEAGSQEVTAVLEKHRRLLELLNQAHIKPEYVYPTDYSQRFSACVPSLLSAVGCWSLLHIAASREVHEGAVGRAMRRPSQMLHMARGIAGTRWLLCHMIGTSGEDYAWSTIRDILNTSPDDERALEYILDVLNHHERTRPRVKEALKVERTFQQLCAAEILAGKRPARDGLSSKPGLPSPSALRLRLSYLTGRLHREWRRTDSAWNTCMARLEDPYPQALTPREEMKSLQQEAWDMHLQFAAALPSNFQCANSEATNLAMVRSARLAAGCCLFRRTRGRLPATLQELVDALPKHFASVPADPFSGRPMLYRKTPKGFVVYSVGEYDPKDNGGKNLFDDQYDPDLTFAVDREAYEAYRQKCIQRNKAIGARRRPGQRSPKPSPISPDRK